MKVARIIIRTVIITLVIFYWTIARHEGSHFLMAYLEGADIYQVRLIPGIHEELGFYFAYVRHSEETSWLTEAAPFFADVLLLVITSALLLWKRKIKFFNAIVLLGFISPIIDLIYNYQGGLWRSGTDVSDLISLLPAAAVHIAFIATILTSITALFIFRNRSIKT